MQILGVDIGGTGIKAAPVDVTTGKLVAERVKLATPHPAEPDAVAGVVHDLVTGFGWKGPAGIAFPGVITGGITRTAANLARAWIGMDARAAGMAEMKFGAGAGRRGTVLMLTFGTGIGSALFIDGILVPNTEFGHIEIRGKDAERRASEHAKDLHDLSWEAWAGRVDEYLAHMEALLSPGLIIVGGGISRKSDKFLPLLTGLTAPVVPAAMHNDAGIVGAAMAAS